jgi:hypothetical protein
MLPKETAALESNPRAAKKSNRRTILPHKSWTCVQNVSKYLTAASAEAYGANHYDDAAELLRAKDTLETLFRPFGYRWWDSRPSHSDARQTKLFREEGSNE